MVNAKKMDFTFILQPKFYLPIFCCSIIIFPPQVEGYDYPIFFIKKMISSYLL